MAKTNGTNKGKTYKGIKTAEEKRLAKEIPSAKTVLEQLREMNLDPVKELVKMLGPNSWPKEVHSFLKRPETEVNIKQKARMTANLRKEKIDVLKTLIEYSYAKMKSVEVKPDSGGKNIFNIEIPAGDSDEEAINIPIELSGGASPSKEKNKKLH